MKPALIALISALVSGILGFFAGAATGGVAGGAAGVPAGACLTLEKARAQQLIDQAKSDQLFQEVMTDLRTNLGNQTYEETTDCQNIMVNLRKAFQK